MKNKEGFTLIELLAVIVIMAVLALIAIPITINIISDSRENVHKRSIENYGRKVEEAYLEAKMNGGSVPNTLEELEKIVLIKTSGEKVVCDKNIDIVDQENEKITLTNCYVAEEGNDQKQKSKYKYNYINGKAEKIDSEEENNSDSSTDQNYNTNDYNTGDYNTNNYDNTSMYTTGEGNNDNNYADVDYQIGDKIRFRNQDYHVIKNSLTSENYVTVLKDEPLTVEEVNMYGEGHINEYSKNSIGTAQNYSGYGGISYYTSSLCGYVNGVAITLGCTSDYDNSDVRYVVNNWMMNNFNSDELKEVDGYKARIATKEEILPIGWPNCVSNTTCSTENTIYDWIYVKNSSYFYWTMTTYSSSRVWHVMTNNSINSKGILYNINATIRPVINIYKSNI